MNKRRVAVTGIGMVTPLGNDTQSSWRALLNKQSGIAEIKNFDASGFPTRIAAEIKNFDPTQYIKDKKLLSYTVPFTTFAFAAAEEAFNDAGIRPIPSAAEQWGIVVGSGMMTAEFAYWSRFQQHFAQTGEVDTHALNHAGREQISSAEFGKTQANSCLDLLLKHYQIKGYSTSVHTACASGGQALGLAMQAIRRGDADYILAGGFDSMINPIGLSSFCLLGALSNYNDTPHTASRPFDLTRNGFVLGEGATFLILEEWERAQARGAKIYAELAGEGNSLSSYRITDSPPSGDGPMQALQAALADANVTIDDVDYINAHGTSTKMNDLSETNAIKAVFKHRAKQIPTSSTKSQTGHLIAAAGALEGAISVLAIYHNTIPMTMNLQNADPECDLDFVIDAPRSQQVRVAVSNSFGFGGSNSCVVFKNGNYYE